jgi:hypothetical protein
MEKIVFFLGAIFVIVQIASYRHDLKHFFNKMYYGKKKYAFVKKIWYGNYDAFLEGCENLIANGQPSGQMSGEILSNKMQRMIVDTARKKGWLKKFINEAPEYVKKCAVYPYRVKEIIWW